MPHLLRAKRFSVCAAIYLALYRGTLTNGDEFDKNEDRDDPFKFTIGTGQVIKGWDQGFATMKKG